MRRGFRIAVVALAAGAACGQPAAPPPSAPPALHNAASEAKVAESGACPAIEDAPIMDTVRPPTADDLAIYLDDCGGVGPLSAVFKTSMGEIHCELFVNRAPIAVANFVGLARGLKPFQNADTNQVEQRPYYDGTTFHRVIPNFMIQGGDPRGNGTGGPGYQFRNEQNVWVRHDRPGVLAMANAGVNTNGSQFYITQVATPHLDHHNTVFGHCDDIDIVTKIASVPRDASDRPLTPVVLGSVEISRVF